MLWRAKSGHQPGAGRDGEAHLQTVPYRAFLQVNSEGADGKGHKIPSGQRKMVSWDGAEYPHQREDEGRCPAPEEVHCGLPEQEAKEEGLWGTLVDFMTVYSKEDISVTFKDGTEIQIG